VIRRAVVAIAIVVALLATLFLAPAAEARPDRKRGKARVEKQAEPRAEAAGEEAKPADNVVDPKGAIPLDNAAPAADNAAASGAIHESDVPAAVATGRPLPQPPAAPAEGPSFFWAAVKMVIALGLVLAMLLGISHLMKKYMDRFGAGGTAPGRAIAVTEARHVAPKTQVMVVEALGNRYLIGVTPSQVTLIDKVPAGRPEKGA
jgi:flagellar biogenesis protein FliO